MSCCCLVFVRRNSIFLLAVALYAPPFQSPRNVDLYAMLCPYPMPHCPCLSPTAHSKNAHIISSITPPQPHQYLPRSASFGGFAVVFFTPLRFTLRSLSSIFTPRWPALHSRGMPLPITPSRPSRSTLFTTHAAPSFIEG